MKNLLILAFVAISFTGFSNDNPIKKMTTVAPPATNGYMKCLIASPDYRKDLQQAILANCQTVLDNFQGQTTVEAVNKLKFVKDVLNGGQALTFLVSVLTTPTNHTDIGNYESGLTACASAFTADLDKNVKVFYGVSF
jgi:hypothetical protein